MQKIRIVALKDAEYDIIRELQGIGVIEIKKSGLDLENDEEPGQAAEVSEQLVKFRSALSFIEAPKKKFTAMQPLELQELLKRCRATKEVEEINSLMEARRSLSERVKGTEYALATSRLFEGMDVDFGKLSSKVLAFRAFNTDPANARLFRVQVTEKGIKSDIIESVKGKRSILFVAFDASQRSMMDEAVQRARMEEIDITEGALNAKPRVVIARLEKEKEEEAKEMASVEQRFKRISEEHYVEIASLAELLEAEYERAQVRLDLKKTERTFVMEGWVPKKSMDRLYDHMRKATKQKFYIEEVHDDEMAPTLLVKPGIFGPFDYLMGFYSLPRSDEIDPTLIFALSFMVFYGMMISDVGYGIMSLIFGTLLVKKFPEEGLMNSVAKIWQLASIPIMAFGLVSNQFFGLSFAPFKGIMLIDWVNNVPGVLTLTLLMGIAQIIVGLAIGFVNESMHHHMKLAISKLTSIVVVIAGTLAIGGALFGFMSSIATTTAAIAILASIVTIALSGIEAVEFTNLISHSLSYTRIFGFGLASVILASLIDKAFTPSLSGGILPFIAIGAVFLALHSMNMILSIFEGIVQASRLNFIEFFTKFYKGGGEKFSPYHFDRRYTKE
jgi:V/A-type H+-transporting ATPase subunit I